MHEMWKRQYAHEDARDMYWAEICPRIWEDGEATYGRTRHGKKEWTGRAKSWFGAENAN